MGEVTITVPDELLHRARLAGLNLSRLAAFAIIAELDREAELQALDAYVREVDQGLRRRPPTPAPRPRAAWEEGPLPDRPAPDQGDGGAPPG